MARGSSTITIGRRGLPRRIARSSSLTLPSTHTTPPDFMPPMFLSLPTSRALMADCELAWRMMLNARSLSVIEGVVVMLARPTNCPLISLATVPTALSSVVAEFRMADTVENMGWLLDCVFDVEESAALMESLADRGREGVMEDTTVEPTNGVTDLTSERGRAATTLVRRGHCCLGRLWKEGPSCQIEPGPMSFRPKPVLVPRSAGLSLPSNQEISSVPGHSFLASSHKWFISAALLAKNGLRDAPALLTAALMHLLSVEMEMASGENEQASKVNMMSRISMTRPCSSDLGMVEPQMGVSLALHTSSCDE